MTLAARWKTAKTAFETTTGKKKPSDKFLGVFRKGTGVESALKDVDSAKKAADLRKALVKFNSAYTDYLKQLGAAAADPKSVPAADKPAYVAAIDKLKSELQSIEADGEAIGKTLEQADGKDKVDADIIKQANDYQALRERGVTESAELLKAFKASKVKIDGFLANCTKHLNAAKQAAKQSDTANHLIAVDLINRYIGEIQTVVKAVQGVYKAKVTDGSSTMMQARQDPSAKMTDKLPESIRKTYLAKSGATFRVMSANTAALTSLLGEIENAVDEARALLSQAEGAGSQLKDPKVYIDQLTELVKEIETVSKNATTKGDRIVKGNDQVADVQKKPKDEALRWYDLQEGQWSRYEPDMKNVRQKLLALATQASSLPKAARETPKVKALTVDALKAAKVGTDYVDSVMLAGSQLLAKIKLQRARAQ